MPNAAWGSRADGRSSRAVLRHGLAEHRVGRALRRRRDGPYRFDEGRALLRPGTKRPLHLPVQPFPQIAVLLVFGNGQRGPPPDIPDGGKHAGSPRAGENIRNEVDWNLPSRLKH